MDKKELLNTEVENLDGEYGLNKLRKYHNFYFAGLPTKESLEKLKEQGVTRVIDFSEPGEGGDYGKEMVEAAGLEYINIPVGGCHVLGISKCREVNSYLDHNKKTLLHCVSGNRVGSWFATHLYLGHNFSVDEALNTAQKIGMDRMPFIEGTKEVLGNLEKLK